jgi:bla regulator protein BlaR1
MIADVTNHLWQSTVFAGVAGLLTLALRGNRARVRHTVWLIASLKFLIPFATLTWLGSRIEWRRPIPTSPTNFAIVIDQVAQPFSSVVPVELPAVHPQSVNWLPSALLIVWACGVGSLAMVWAIRLRRIQRLVRASSSLDLGLPIVTRSSESVLEPGVFGIVHPVLLLPEGIVERLTRAQLQSVITHELCHVRHRDNLIAAVQMFVETIFWFHPLVWWIGKQMIAERERACDEAVLTLGNDSHVYAEAILNVCKLYVESPLVCVSGITGAGLKQRIQAIVANRPTASLNRTKKLLLAAAAAAAIAAPIAIGIVNAPVMSAQSRDASLKFEVASVKENKSGATRSPSMIYPGGRFTATNNTVRDLILNAYGISAESGLLEGGPPWIDSTRYDIEARPTADAIPPNTPTRLVWQKTREMLRTLLAERFKLSIKTVTKEVPIYELVPAKGGAKLIKSAQDCDASAVACHGFSGNPTRLSGRGIDMYDLALMLTGHAGRPVRDKTGIQGVFDIQLHWNPFAGRTPAEEPERPAQASGREGVNPELASLPALIPALREQVGLTLESRKGPVEMFVIERVERPSDNFTPPPQAQELAPPVAAKSQPPRFDVISSKPRPRERREYLLKRECVNDRFVGANTPLSWIINWSFGLHDWQVTGLPEWSQTFQDSYDLEAKAAAPMGQDQCRAMVQSLLADRLQMKAHRETRELPVYFLVIGKTGSKLRDIESGAGAPGAIVNGTQQIDGEGSEPPRGWPVARLANVLSDIRSVGRPVIDKTGLSGVYSFNLVFSTKEGDEKPSIFTAVQEQLGLRLEPARAPLELLVVDHLEKPTAN